jgi:hypothetical protein
MESDSDWPKCRKFKYIIYMNLHPNQRQWTKTFLLSLYLYIWKLDMLFCEEVSQFVSSTFSVFI